MSFDDEWAGVRAEAHTRRAAKMELAGLEGDRSGGANPPQYQVTSSDLTHHAEKADIVRGDFAKVDDTALKETGPVGGSLKGFASAAAFKVFEDRWQSQMTYVEGLLEKDVAAALRSSALTFDEEEAKQRQKFHGRGKGDDRALK